MLNATVQMHVEDEFRGRVMGVYSMMLVGVGSLGAILMGMLSEWLGIESTFFLCGGTLFITSLIALRYNKHLIV
ncbi:MAG: MFS transporter [Rhodocyclaceae bacterium]|nr:MFS transporter [Rhodocyclaceae bacterium]